MFLELDNDTLVMSSLPYSSMDIDRCRLFIQYDITDYTNSTPESHCPTVEGALSTAKKLSNLEFQIGVRECRLFTEKLHHVCNCDERRASLFKFNIHSLYAGISMRGSHIFYISSCKSEM